MADADQGQRALVVKVAVAEEVVVAGFLFDRLQPVADPADLVVFGVRVAEVAGQDVAFDGVDALLRVRRFALRFIFIGGPQFFPSFSPPIQLAKLFVESRAVAGEMLSLVGRFINKSVVLLLRKGHS